MLTSQDIKQYALKAGADLVGIAPALFDEEGFQRLQNYIEKGRQGDMKYLEDFGRRVDPDALLPGAQSVIVIAVNYYYEQPPLPKGHGRIARYAHGRDYHKVLKKILKDIAAYIQARAQRVPSLKQAPTLTKICIDSSPLLERAYAVNAGLGFIGKNTMLITPQFGSFVLLGEILTTLKLDPDQPRDATAPTCGTCTRCIDACPTQAIVAPRELDATKCISYLTIESKGEVPPALQKPMAKHIFGCDICQEVCPYNKTFAQPLTLEAFKEPVIAGASLQLDQILALPTDDAYLKQFAGSPLMRTKRKGLQRNARIAKNNA